METLVDQKYNHHQQKIKYLHQKTINFITVTYIKILDAYINCVITKAYIKTTVELDVLAQMTTP